MAPAGGDNADSFSISRLLTNISIAILHEPFVKKDLVVQKREFKKQHKILSQSALPIKKEVKPQLKNNYKPNTYINNNYHAKSYR